MSRRPSAVEIIRSLAGGHIKFDDWPSHRCCGRALRGSESAQQLTADALVSDQPVVIDHRVGDGYLCAGLFDDLGGGVAKDLAQ